MGIHFISYAMLVIAFKTLQGDPNHCRPEIGILKVCNVIELIIWKGHNKILQKKSKLLEVDGNFALNVSFMNRFQKSALVLNSLLCLGESL